MLLAGLILAGCSHNEQPADSDMSGDMCEFLITINTSATASPVDATRANDNLWGDNPSPEIGTDIENTIDNISLYLVTDNGYHSLTKVGQDISDGKYEFKVRVALGVINATSVGHHSYIVNGRLVAVVNHPAGIDFANPFEPDEMDIADINKKGYIPMWGVKTLTDVMVTSNSTQHIGEVQLLRSLPKISIMMADNFKASYKITNISADQPIYRKYSRCAPADALTATSTENLWMEGGFNPTLNTITNPLLFSGLGTESICCYLPETPLALQNGMPPSLTVTLERKDGTAAPFTGKIYLCDYTDGSPKFESAFPGLVRNHDYQYKISLSEMQFIVSVEQWRFGGKVHLDLE